MKNIRLTAVALLCACVACVFVGCGQKGPKKVSISGVVTVDGEPVGKGSIRFKPADGVGVTDGGRIVDGKFEAEVTTGEKILIVDGSKIVGQFEADPVLNPGVMSDQLEMYPGMPFKQEKTITVEKKGQTFEIDYSTEAE